MCKLSCQKGPDGSMSQIVGLSNNSYKPITNVAWVRARLCKLQKRCTRLAAASDKFYQLLVHGRWFFAGTPASSTTKTGHHDIAEILLKVALNTKNQSIICQTPRLFAGLLKLSFQKEPSWQLQQNCQALSLRYPIKCARHVSEITFINQ